MNMKNKLVSVIIPALNEEESIGRVIEDIPKNRVKEIIVVDNGSTDSTGSAARKAGAKVFKQPEKGYGAACLKAIDNISNSSIIVFLDGDYSDYPEEMDTLINPIIENRADFVLGSRISGSDGKRVLHFHAYIGNILCTLLIRLLYGFNYTDFGPFRAIRANSLKQLNMKDRNYGWTAEMQVKAIKHKLRILEVPVRYRQRIGRSKVSGTITGSIRAAVKIIITILQFKIRD